MKVDFKNTTVTKGLIFKKTFYDLHVSFQLTEEEKAIIKARGLEEFIIMEHGKNASMDTERENNITFETLLDGIFWTDFATPSDVKDFQEALASNLKKAKAFLSDNETNPEDTSIEI